MVDITKKIVEEGVRYYINKNMSPSDQPEPRDSKYFDIRGIVQEMYEWLKEAPTDLPKAEITAMIRKVMRLAERRANLFKTHRVTELHIADVFQQFAVPIGF